MNGLVIVLAQKCKGDLRFCVDLCEGNKSVILGINLCLGQLVPYSQNNLNSAYQLSLHLNSQSITAFITHEGPFNLMSHF